MNTESEILKGVLSIVKNISDPQFQQKAWIEKKVQPYDFFEEAMHQLFDDYELADIISNYKVYDISNEQHKILADFYSALDQYTDEKMSWSQAVDPKEVLDDPRWHEIQKKAKEVLKAFNQEKTD